MKQKIEKMAHDLHSLSNRFIVIDKAFEVFAKNVPESRLNELSKKNIDEAKNLVADLKNLCIEMMEVNSEIKDIKEHTQAENHHMLYYWYMSVTKKKAVLEEMFPIKITFTEKEIIDSLEYPDTIDEIFFNTLEYISTLGGTEVMVDIMPSTKKPFIAITDNATEEINESSPEMQSIIGFCNKVDAALDFKSIQGIGNNIKITF